MGAIASQITSLTIVYSTVYSGADQSKHQSSASLAFVWRIHRGPVNSPHKWPVTRKMFPFDDVIMDRCLTDIDPMVFAIWMIQYWSLVTPNCGVLARSQSALVQVMDCHLLCANPLTEPMLQCWLDILCTPLPRLKFVSRYTGYTNHSWKYIW